MPYTSLDSVRAYLVFDQGRRWAVGYYRTEEGFEERAGDGAVRGRDGRPGRAVPGLVRR